MKHLSDCELLCCKIFNVIQMAKLYIDNSIFFIFKDYESND